MVNVKQQYDVNHPRRRCADFTMNRMSISAIIYVHGRLVFDALAGLAVLKDRELGLAFYIWDGTCVGSFYLTQISLLL
jgi:hypothetical protein